MKKIGIVVAILSALLGATVSAQEDSEDRVRTTTEVRAGVREAAEAGAQTLSEVRERVASGAETVSEIGERASARLAEVEDQVSEGMANSINGAIDQIGDLIRNGIVNTIAGIADDIGDLVRTVTLILTVVAVSFVTGMVIVIRGREGLGCALAIGIGIIAGMLAGLSIGFPEGLTAAIGIGIIVPFAGTFVAITLFAAARSWIAGASALYSALRTLAKRRKLTPNRQPG